MKLYGKQKAIRKVEIAIDKLIDLEDYTGLEGIAEDRARLLDSLRELETKIRQS